MHDRKTIGELGETLVATWLQTQNCEILKQRWHCRLGEIDLIACTPAQTIALIEVKTRSTYNWDINGLLAISPSKQRKLWKTAELFIVAHPQWADRPYHFDVALVGHSQSRPKHPGLFVDSQQGHYFSLHTYLENAFNC
jgi:putative endonuclease